MTNAVPATGRIYRGRSWIVGSAVLAGLLTAPWILDAYAISTGSQMLVLGLVAMSASLLTGVAGLPTLAQAAYFAIGAYTAALLAEAGVTVGPAQLVAAVVVATATAMITGFVVVRTRGVTFLMLSLAIGELVHSASKEWRGLTGGTDGITGIPAVVPVPGMAPLTNDGLVFYYILAVFLLLFLLTGALVRSPYGLALRGIRDNEDRMRAAGYPVYGYLLGGYSAAGALAGAAGALWTSLMQYVSPGDASFGMAAMALIAAVIGGTSSMWGACVGAALVVLVRDYLANTPLLSNDYTVSGPLMLGLMFIVVVYALPQGLAGMAASRLWPRRTSRSPDVPEVSR